MKNLLNVFLLVAWTSNANAVIFDYNCRPMFSNVKRNSMVDTMKVQSYSWSLVDKVMPDALLKKFYSLTPAGATMDDHNPLVKELWDDCFRFDWVASEMKPENTCSGEMFTEKTSGHAELTLFKNYCQKNMPDSVKEMFKTGFDVPSDFVKMWDSSYLSSNYKTENISAQYLLQKEKDIETFFQLNVEAEKVWQEILACAEGDTERARLAIFEGGEICGTNVKLKSLAVNVTNYFSSSKAVADTFYDSLEAKLLPGAIYHDSPLVAANYDFGGYEKVKSDYAWDGEERSAIGEFWTGKRARIFQSGENIESKISQRIGAAKAQFPNLTSQRILDNRIQIHPLFSQIVMEIFAFQFLSTDLIDVFGKINEKRFYNDWRHETATDTKTEAKNLANNIPGFALVYLNRMCEPAGLWPSAGFSALLYMQRAVSKGLPMLSEKYFPTQTIGPEFSSDYLRIGYWAGDFGRAQMNCNRGKVLPDIYYDKAENIVKKYREMFLRHTN